MSSTTEDFRAEYRSGQIGPHYSGWLHLASTAVGSLLPIVGALVLVRHPSIGELLTVPVTCFIANMLEYWIHRGPLHHPAPLIGIAFERHALEHHMFYTESAMEAESTRDFKMILFPPVMLAVVLLMIVPIAAALYFLAPPNVAFLYVATGFAYYLNYEVFHWAYHQPASAWIRRVPGVNHLRQLHLNHHNPAWMTRYNFNITYPIGDHFFRTYRSTVAKGPKGQ